MPLFLALALMIAVLACGFALQNTNTAAVTFLVWKYEASLALVLLSTFAMGAGVGLLACLPALVRGRLKLAEMGRRVRELEAAAVPKPDAGPAPGRPSPGGD